MHMHKHLTNNIAKSPTADFPVVFSVGGYQISVFVHVWPWMWTFIPTAQALCGILCDALQKMTRIKGEHICPLCEVYSICSIVKKKTNIYSIFRFTSWSLLFLCEQHVWADCISVLKNNWQHSLYLHVGAILCSIYFITFQFYATFYL